MKSRMQPGLFLLFILLVNESAIADDGGLGDVSIIGGAFNILGEIIALPFKVVGGLFQIIF